jgi:hypothetical protein
VTERAIAIEFSLQAAIGLGQIALASVNDLQRFRNGLEWVRKTGQPAFVKMLKSEKIIFCLKL